MALHILSLGMKRRLQVGFRLLPLRNRIKAPRILSLDMKRRLKVGFRLRPFHYLKEGQLTN